LVLTSAYEEYTAQEESRPSFTPQIVCCENFVSSKTPV